MYFGNWSWLIVGGCPRSGTTMLNFLLNSHPAIRLTNENSFARLLEQVGQLFYREQRLPSVPERVKGPNENWRREDVERATLQFEKCALPVLKTLYASHFADQVQLDEVAYFGDKLPCYYDGDWERVRNFLQPLKVIHISRDPRDVVNSMLRRAKNAREGKDSWRACTTPEQACHAWARGWNFICGQKQPPAGVEYLHLKYEDLVGHPQRELARVCDFLQVEDRFDRSSIVLNARSERETLDRFAEIQITELLPGVADDWHYPLTQLEQRYSALPHVPPAPESNASKSMSHAHNPSFVRRFKRLVWTAFQGGSARSN